MTPHPYRCPGCGRTQPLEFAGWKCPACGGVLDLNDAPVFDPDRVDARAPGVWRYRHTFPLPDSVEPVSLGEGGTPLIPVDLDGRRVCFKHEGLNPTGSFKDRGMAVLFAALRQAGAAEAVEDSSGNAGASFAGYAARAGVRARVYVPASAAGPKRAQIAAYGAELVAVEGPRSKAAEAVQAAAAAGARYASHVYHPLPMAGLATAAFELWEALGHAPESILAPTGHGTLLLGLQRGFEALRRGGLIERLPRLVGVQALACAPLWAARRYGPAGLSMTAEGATVAEGIRVVHPVRGDAVLRAAADLLAVEEAEILPGRDALARLGLYVEATCGVVWPALRQVSGEVVVMLTGHGLKTPLV